jgi:hypothetical protein
VPSAALFSVVPVAALAASAPLLFVGFGGLDRWLVRPIPAPAPAAELLAAMSASPRADRAGVLTAAEEASLSALDRDPAGLAAALAGASGVYRAELLTRRAAAAERAGDLSAALEDRALARALVPTDLRLLADVAALQRRLGDEAGFVASAREWRQLGGALPRERAAALDAWLEASVVRRG